LLEDLVAWKKDAIDVSDEAYVFPSERLTPLAMENVWRRNIGQKLDKVGLGGGYLSGDAADEFVPPCCMSLASMERSSLTNSGTPSM